MDDSKGRYPSPGHKTYVGDMAARPLSGQWQLSYVEREFAGKPWYAPDLNVAYGVPAPRKDDALKNGANLIYDNYPGYSDAADTTGDDENAMDVSAKIKRHVLQAAMPLIVSSNRSSVPYPTLSRRGSRSGEQAKIQWSNGADTYSCPGSWLDPRVYSEILQCSEDLDDDYGEEEYLDIQDDWLVMTASSSTTSTSVAINSTTSTSAAISSKISSSPSTTHTTTAAASSTTSVTSDIESLTASSCYPITTPTSADGSYEVEFEVADAAVDKFCNTLSAASAVIGPETHAPAVDPYFPDNNRGNNPIFMHAIWNGTGSSCKALNFGSDESALETCRLNLYRAQMSCMY